MLSRELEETLRRAMSAASSHNHEFATLEHLLLALTEDSDAIEVLSACKVDIDELRARVSDYIENELASIVSPTSGVDVQSKKRMVISQKIKAVMNKIPFKKCLIKTSFR